MKRENGFTLVELLAVMLLMSLLVGLGAYAFRRHWQTRALRGSIDEVVTELRAEQQKASSESHPWVRGAWFKPGSPRWGVVRANASTGACQVTSRRTLPAGVVVDAAVFADVTAPALSSTCATAAETGSEIVLFFARGSATEGTVSLSQPQVAGGTPRTVAVSPITGRVTAPW